MRDIVRRGYDTIAESYLAWSLENDWPGRRLYLGYLLDALDPGSDVLELGCGAGLPATRALVDAGHRVTAVDLSVAQLALARRHVPEAQLVRADMAELELPPASFDAVCAFYSLTHVPRGWHADLLAHIAAWLRPEGIFVASFGCSDNPAQIEEDWLGAPMFMSHFDAATSRTMVEEAGLELVRHELVAQVEHGQEGAFLWVLAKRA
jgi:cyclopropane fatty-acyl-phospholipid synthase-like methyltransferase